MPKTATKGPGVDAEELSAALELQFEPRMSDADALMWSIEKDPGLRSTILSVVLFDGPLDHELVRRRTERLTRVVPRLRQRVRSNPLSIAPPRWEIDPNFDLAYHLRWVSAPGNGTMRELLDFAAPIAMQGFDRARPLWETFVVDGLEGDRSALIQKIHHSITDGVGGMKIQLELYDFSPGAPERQMPPEPDGIVLTQPERIVDASLHEARRGMGLLRRALTVGPEMVGSLLTNPVGAVEATSELVGSIGRLTAPTPHPLSPIMTGRSLSVHLETLTFPLDRAKQAARKVGARMNAAFVGAMGLGLYHYHRELGAECTELRMSMPISVRSEGAGDTVGNAFVPARFVLPIDGASAEANVRNAHLAAESAKHEPANALAEDLSALINRLPTSLTTALFGSMMRGADLTTSNVPGSPIPVYLGERRLLAQFPFGPNAGVATNITLVSYQNDCNVGINTDTAAVEDPALLCSCLQRGVDEVLALA